MMGYYGGRCAVRVLINRREPTLSSGSMRSLGSDASRFKASIGGRRISFVFPKPYGEIGIERQRHKKPDLTAECIVLLGEDRLPLPSLPFFRACISCRAPNSYSWKRQNYKARHNRASREIKRKEGRARNTRKKRKKERKEELVLVLALPSASKWLLETRS